MGMYKNIALHFNYKSNHIYFEKNINYGYCKTEIILVLNHKIIYDSYRKYKNKNHVDKSCLNYNIDNNIYILQSIVIDNYILYDTYDIEELCNYNLKLYINNGEVSISNYILNKNLYILNYDNIILNKLNIFNLNKFYNIAI